MDQIPESPIDFSALSAQAVQIMANMWPYIIGYAIMMILMKRAQRWLYLTFNIAPKRRRSWKSQMRHEVGNKIYWERYKDYRRMFPNRTKKEAADYARWAKNEHLN